jgi:hypothetical protein
VLKMTGKNVNMQGSWGDVTLSSNDITFGPKSFTRDPTESLYAENVKAGQVARARDVNARSLTEIAGDVVKGVISGAKAVGGRYKKGVYARTYDIGTIDAPGYVTSSSADIPYVLAKPAKQSWLQNITKKIGRYVFGATVTEGNTEGVKEGIYIDDGLDRDEKKYNFYFDNGLFEDAKEYANRAWEAVKTKFHEWGHYALNIKSEYGAERYAGETADKLVAVDKRAAFAKKYRNAA